MNTKVTIYLPYGKHEFMEIGVNIPGHGYFLVIYGKHANGYFCALPSWNYACEMADPDDTFYNTERLSGAGLSESTAKTIVQCIKEAVKAGEK